MNYNLFAPYYDELEPGIEGDIEFYIRECRKSASVLEVGAGTGRVTVPLRKAGVLVTPVEPSAEMAEVLRKKAEKAGVDTAVAVSSLQEYEDAARYDLVILPFRVFQHFYTLDEQLAALAKIRLLLQPHGRLVFDVATYAIDLDFDPEWQLQYEERLSAGSIVKMRTRYDGATSCMHIAFALDTHTKQSDGFSATMRFFEPEEIRQLLESAGFGEIILHGGFAGEPFSATSENMVVFAKAA